MTIERVRLVSLWLDRASLGCGYRLLIEANRPATKAPKLLYYPTLLRLGGFGKRELAALPDVPFDPERLLACIMEVRALYDRIPSLTYAEVEYERVCYLLRRDIAAAKKLAAGIRVRHRPAVTEDAA